jgi:hypothetical protein
MGRCQGDLSGAMIPSFKSKLPAEELSILYYTVPTEKAHGIARKQNAIAMDALVQSMSDTDDFHCIFKSMNVDADWPSGKAWKAWKSIEKHFQPENSTAVRDWTSALLKRNSNPMKTLSVISAVKVRFKKTLNEWRKIEFIQNCARDDYAQVIVVADGIAQIMSHGSHNSTSLEQCKAMRKTWRIAGYKKDEEDDDDNNSNSELLKTSLGSVKHKRSTISLGMCFTCGARKFTRHCPAQ